MTKGVPDPIWDTMEDCFGKVRTKKEQVRRGKAVAELKEASVTPDELKIAYAYCEKKFTHFSEFALCNWLSRALKEHEDERGSRESFLRLLHDKQK